MENDDNDDDDDVGGRRVEMRSKKIPFTFLVEFLVLRVMTDLFFCHRSAAVMQL